MDQWPTVCTLQTGPLYYGPVLGIVHICIEALTAHLLFVQAHLYCNVVEAALNANVHDQWPILHCVL